MIITAENIYLFCKTTGDSNKAHQGENPVVPGFMIDFLAKNHCDALKKDPELQFAGLEMKFIDKLHQGEELIVTPINEENPDVLEYRVELTSGERQIAEGYVFYRHILPEPKAPEKIKPNEKTGIVYLLRRPYYEEIRKALNIPGEDRIAGAVSKAAHTLQNDEESKKVINQETQDGRHPFFAKHSLKIYKTAPETLRKYPVSMLIRTVKGEYRQSTHRVFVYGEADHGLFFDLTAMIRFN